MPDAARHLAAVPSPDDRMSDDNVRRVEQHVLGTAMEAASELFGMRVHVGPEKFADPRHGEIWAAICDAADAGEPTHPTAITERVIRSGLIRRLPGPAYMFDLVQQAVPAQGEYFAGMLAYQHTRREIDAKGARLGHALRDPGTTLDQVVTLAEDVVTAASVKARGADDSQHIADLAATYVDGYFDFGAVPALATPWVDLNRLLTSGGFERGQVVTFGGAPGMGKSIAVTDCARHSGIDLQVPTLLFSLEMTPDQVLCRILAALTGIPERVIKGREMSPDQLVQIGNARARLESSPLWIVAGKTLTVTQIGNIIRQHKHRYGAVHTVIIDYIQIVKTSDVKRENRQLEVSATMQRLKELALTENLLVVTAAQINRTPAQRGDKRPQLSDLRESGEIENSSDIVILLYREDYYDKESPKAGEAEFIVEKQRGGPKGVVHLAAQFHLTRFMSLAESWTPSRLAAA